MHREPDYLIEQKELLLNSLRRKGIQDENVLKALANVPRSLFVLPEFFEKSYEDKALPIICGQTISQPFTVAYMTMILNIQKNHRVLEIGTGSGYQAAILSELAAEVYSIERIPELFSRTSDLLKSLDYKINTFLGDGTYALSKFAPFDRIIVTAGAPEVPSILKDQLAIGGRLVVPVGDRESQLMFVVDRISENDFKEQKREKFKFVPLIGKQGWDEV